MITFPPVLLKVKVLLKGKQFQLDPERKKKEAGFSADTQRGLGGGGEPLRASSTRRGGFEPHTGSVTQTL